MVYQGRPSRGCLKCKSRRIKCDETRPACFNCTRKGWTCPGLPEEVDLIFRNEDPGSKRKNKKSGGQKSNVEVDVVEITNLVDEYEQKQDSFARRSSEQTCTPESQDAWPGIITTSSSQTALILQSRLNPAIEQHATAFFFKNFVFSPRSRETTRGFLEVAFPIFEGTAEGSSLHLAIQAVSVAIISNWLGRRHLSQMAQRLYTKALQSVQKDLHDPNEGTSDATLLSVLMFSLYESVTSAETSIQSWARHIEGAVTLVRARGAEQFKSHQSLVLFRAVRTQMLTNSIQQRKAVADFPAGWTTDMDGEDSATATLMKYTIQLPNLLAKAKELFTLEHTPETLAQVSDLLDQAVTVQRGLIEWEYQMPTQWGYKSVANVPIYPNLEVEDFEELESWPGVVHVYQDVHIAAVRNNNRISQMLCSSIVLDSLKWLSPQDFHTDERFAEARQRLQSLVDDICYSVPFHLYGHGVAQDIKSAGQAEGAGNTVGGYYLIWPLYAASNMQDIPDVQRRWLSRKLSMIARRYGLDRGNIMNSINKGRSGANFSDKLQYATKRRTSEPRIKAKSPRRASRAETLVQAFALR